MKSLELLSVIMGWKWTNDVLVREILWPVFEEWKTKGFHSNPELGSSTAVVAKTTKSNAECEEYNHEANMDTIIGNVLRLLGKTKFKLVLKSVVDLRSRFGLTLHDRNKIQGSVVMLICYAAHIS